MDLRVSAPEEGYVTQSPTLGVGDARRHSGIRRSGTLYVALHGRDYRMAGGWGSPLRTIIGSEPTELGERVTELAGAARRELVRPGGQP